MINFNLMNLSWPERRIGKNHDLCRAIGLNKYASPTILDATAGLARDAFIFAKLGANVTLLERHPDIVALLDNALRECQDLILKGRLDFIPTDALKYLENHDGFYDIIYLDPMFSDTTKRAKVKKDMQFLQEIIGEDHDADALLDAALKKAHKRVVVKRHKRSPFLNNQEPHHQIIGKSTRYDVYLP